jgi:hypothetical protein
LIHVSTPILYKLSPSKQSSSFTILTRVFSGSRSTL